MSDLAAENSRVSLLESIASELSELNYVNAEGVHQRLQGVKDTFANLQQMSDDRKTRIQNAIAAQQSLDSLRLDYAKKAAVRCPCVYRIARTIYSSCSCVLNLEL